MAIDKFYKDTLILTLSNLVTVIIGFIFSVLLSRELGAEGLGLYGLIMPIYGLFLGLTSDGLITAVSRVSTVYYNKKDFRNLNRTMAVILRFIIFWSLIVAVFVFINASNLSSYVIKDLRSTTALKIICPTLLLVALSAIFKGYFYGTDQFKTAAFIDIAEKVLRVAVLLVTISMISSHDVENSVTAAYIALTIGELTSCSLLYIFYKRSRARYKVSPSKTHRRLQLLANVLVISSPLCLNGLISSIFSTASTLVIPRRLMTAGIPYSSALSLIGKFCGMALNITYFPFVIVGSMITVLVPDLSLSVSKNDLWSVEDRISQVIKTAFLVGTATLVICLTVPDSLGMLFYKRGDLGRMIMFAAATTFLSYISSPTYAILNGLGKQNILLRNSVIISVLTLILIYILTGIPSINIYGYGITLISVSVTALFLNIREIRKICEFKLPLYDMSIYAITGVIAYLLLKMLTPVLSPISRIFEVSIVSMLAFAMIFLPSVLGRSTAGK